MKDGWFVVTIPPKWYNSAIIEKVSLQPLYSREDWKIYQTDKRNELKPGYACRPQYWAIRSPDALPEGITFDLKNAGEIQLHLKSSSTKRTNGASHSPMASMRKPRLRNDAKPRCVSLGMITP